MAACSQTDIPILNQQVDPCLGAHTSTNCIFYPEAITYLFIEPNEDLTAVIKAMVLSLQSNNTRIIQLEEENVAQADDITQLKIDVIDLQEAVLEIQATPVDPRPYKVYSALLSQTGVSGPVATVLENTLGDNLLFSYVSPGLYLVELDNGNSPLLLNAVIPQSKLAYVKTNLEGSPVFCFYKIAINEYSFYLATEIYDMRDNNLLENTYIEIIAYN